jgi:hypothetical protein
VSLEHRRQLGCGRANHVVPRVEGSAVALRGGRDQPAPVGDECGHDLDGVLRISYVAEDADEQHELEAAELAGQLGCGEVEVANDVDAGRVLGVQMRDLDVPPAQRLHHLCVDVRLLDGAVLERVGPDVERPRAGRELKRRHDVPDPSCVLGVHGARA